MASLRDLVSSKYDAFRVDPRDLVVNPQFNVRDLDAPSARDGLDILKEDIASVGVQVPLEIRKSDDQLIITSGHRRHKVVMELIAEGHDIQTVPAIAEPVSINDAERVARLITLNAGEPLSAMEKAEVVRRLLNYGWSKEQIAQRFGFRSVQQIANYEELLGAPEEVRQAVRQGELSASAAVALVKSEGDKAGDTLKVARAATKAAGKKKISGPAIRAASKPAAAMTISAKFDRGMSLLLEVAQDGNFTPSRAAGATMRSADQFATLLNWLTDVEDQVKQRSVAA